MIYKTGWADAHSNPYAMPSLRRDAAAPVCAHVYPSTASEQGGEER
jgi:hypothetical protein